MERFLQPQATMHLGSLVARFGLVTVLLVIGIEKFTAAEAQGIEPLVTHSPLFFWMPLVLGVQGTSNFFGLFEIATASLIAARLFSPALGALGSAMATIIFLSTVSFIFSTPGALPNTGTGQFLLKDVTLLGASLWSLGEALAALHLRKAARVM